eukprot:scaffold3012_cov396-Prasinococcus_capsulatus_cf.AAC.9
MAGGLGLWAGRFCPTTYPRGRALRPGPGGRTPQPSNRTRLSEVDTPVARPCKYPGGWLRG